MDPYIIKMVEWLEEWFFKKTNIVTSFSNSLSDVKVPSEKLIKNSLDNKVDKANGKGLSTNDYDNVAKAKVDGLANVALTGSYNDLTNKPNISEQIDIDTTLNVNSNNAVTNNAITTALNNKANSTHSHTKNQITDFPTLANVATSGSYNDLIDKPTISEEIDVDNSLNVNSNNPVTNNAITTALNNKSNTNHTHTKNQITDFPTFANVAFSGSYDDLTNKPEISGSGEIVDIGFGFDRETKEIYLEFNSE